MCDSPHKIRFPPLVVLALPNPLGITKHRFEHIQSEEHFTLACISSFSLVTFWRLFLLILIPSRFHSNNLFASLYITCTPILKVHWSNLHNIVMISLELCNTPRVHISHTTANWSVKNKSVVVIVCLNYSHDIYESHIGRIVPIK